jgi:WD40 repeat protein/serine/threonine protein kinase
MATQPPDTTDRESRLDEVLGAYYDAVARGEPIDRRAWIDRHSDLAGDLAAFFAEEDRFDRMTAPLRAVNPGPDIAMDAPVGLPVDFGDYELLEQIGRGGMGVVYRARQKSLNRIVALKLIPAGPLALDHDLLRFRAEAEAAATLDNPNIVPIYAIGEHRGVRYFSMKLIEGGSLASRPAQFTSAPRAAARLVATIARAVHHAHQRGILHRDLKPSNILLATQAAPDLPSGIHHPESAVCDLPSFVPFVADFGLAKRLESSLELTRSGALLGSPPYMAPEQATAQKGGITTATDVYGLGAILYALLTGRPPFEADSAWETIERVKARTPDSPSGANRLVDRDLQTICLKCLEKEAARRYASAEALADDLDCWLQGAPIAARPIAVWHRAWKRVRRRPAPALAVLAGALAVSLVVLGPWLWGRHRADQAIIRERDLALRAEADQKRAGQYVRGIQSAARLIELGDSRQAHDLLQSLGTSGEDHPRGFEWFRLERLCSREPVVVRDHLGDVYFATYAPDGTLLATCGKDGTIRLRDPTSGQTRRVIGPVGTELNGLSFSPDGSRLAAAGDDGVIRVWDLAKGDDPSLTIPAHGKAEAVGVFFSPDGRYLLSGGRDDAVRRWDAKSGELRHSWQARIGQIESGAIAREKPWALIGGWAPGASTTSANLFDWSTGELLARFGEGGPRRVSRHYAVAITPDGRTAATQGSDGAVLLWNPGTRRIIRTLMGHHDSIFSIAFSPSGTSLATLGVDGELRLWDLTDSTSTSWITGHIERAWCVTFSPNGSRLATTGREGSVRLWDAGNSTERAALAGLQRFPRTLAFSTNDMSLTAHDDGGGFAMWNVVDGALVRSQARADVSFAAYSFDGARLVINRKDSPVFEIFNYGIQQPLMRISKLNGSIFALALSRDGRRLAVSEATFNGPVVVRVLNAESGVEIARLPTPPDQDGTRHLAWSPAGERLAGESDNGWLWIWEAGTVRRSHVQYSGNYNHRVNSLAFSSDGSRLAIGGEARMISILDVKTLRTRAELSGHVGSVVDLDFSPDGLSLASASTDQTVRLWNLATGQELLRLEGHSGPVRCVHFAHDGRTLASAADIPSGGGEVILWRTGYRANHVSNAETQTDKETSVSSAIP